MTQATADGTAPAQAESTETVGEAVSNDPRRAWVTPDIREHDLIDETTAGAIGVGGDAGGYS